MSTPFKERSHAIFQQHQRLTSGPNPTDFSENAIYERQAYPVLTAAHSRNHDGIYMSDRRSACGFRCGLTVGEYMSEHIELGEVHVFLCDPAGPPVTTYRATMVVLSEALSAGAS